MLNSDSWELGCSAAKMHCTSSCAAVRTACQRAPSFLGAMMPPSCESWPADWGSCTRLPVIHVATTFMALQLHRHGIKRFAVPAGVPTGHAPPLQRGRIQRVSILEGPPGCRQPAAERSCGRNQKSISAGLRKMLAVRRSGADTVQARARRTVLGMRCGTRARWRRRCAACCCILLHSAEGRFNRTMARTLRQRSVLGCSVLWAKALNIVAKDKG